MPSVPIGGVAAGRQYRVVPYERRTARTTSISRIQIVTLGETYTAHVDSDTGLELFRRLVDQAR
jgi:hypothetical protein